MSTATDLNDSEMDVIEGTTSLTTSKSTTSVNSGRPDELDRTHDAHVAPQPAPEKDRC